MRRYWHPLAPAVHLDENPVRRVRLLGEDLTLYRDRSGTLGLIGDRCPHRMMDMQFGIPEETGLRCPYHGWLFDETGTCLETPLEPPDSRFKEKVSIKNYQVQELGGLIFAYMGPEPAPLLPRWDLYIRPDGFRQIVANWLPCNWLQVMENRGDTAHAIYLHGRLFQYALERDSRLTDDPKAIYNAIMKPQEARLKRGAYIRHRPVYNQFGFTKGNLESDRDESESSWAVGINPILFPYHLAFGPGGMGIRQSYQIGVPIDDYTTWHFQYFCYTFPEGVDVPKQDTVPYVEVPLAGRDGRTVLDNVLSGDMVSWYGQGEFTDRTQEHLAASDINVIAYRKLLREQIEIVQDAGDPMNVFRDPDTIEAPELVLVPPNLKKGRTDGGGNSSGNAGVLSHRLNYHKKSEGGWLYMDDDVDRYCPDKEAIVRMYEQAEQVWDAMEGK
jgi:5,5'-dehydrodivanillate O-demethylase